MKSAPFNLLYFNVSLDLYKRTAVYVTQNYTAYGRGDTKSGQTAYQYLSNGLSDRHRYVEYSGRWMH